MFARGQRRHQREICSSSVVALFGQSFTSGFLVPERHGKTRQPRRAYARAAPKRLWEPESGLVESSPTG